MSDLRISAQCRDCDNYWSGTSTLTAVAEHVDVNPEHRVVVSKSGDLT